MYVIDGIAYAGEAEKPTRVVSVRPMENHQLWVRFPTGEVKMFDFTLLLDSPCFLPLRDKDAFHDVYIDYGIPVWCDGSIDIAPEKLYAEGVAANAS